MTLSSIMETSLHRQLKGAYADPGARLEVPLGSYRIDVASDDRLIEIQHGSLGAIRDKVRDLVRSHDVLVVKPIVRRKHLVKLDGPGGEVVDRRLSPKRGREIDVFDELIHFTRAFPHPRLTLEVLLVDIEERRYPGHGKRRRRRDSDFVVEDQEIVDVLGRRGLRDADDLVAFLPDDLPGPFDTADLAEALELPRWRAQRVAYCLRETGAVARVGKDGNAWLYECCSA